jgi:hypothetical protein
MQNSWSVSFGYCLALAMFASAAAPSPTLAQANGQSDQAASDAALVRALQQYMRHGADMATVPRGQPGSEYIHNGANALTVPSGNDPAAQLFRRGADATSVNDDYLRNGARVTSVPSGNEPGADYYRNGAAATNVPAKGQPGAEYFNNGAAATNVPARGQPGAEYFNNGATATSLNAATSARRSQPQPEAQPEQTEKQKAEPAAEEKPAEPEPVVQEKAAAPQAAAPAATTPTNTEEQGPPDIAPAPEPASSAQPRSNNASVAPLPEDKGEHAAVPPVPIAPEVAAEPSALAHLVDRYAGGVRLFAAAFVAAIGVLALAAIWLVRRAKRAAGSGRSPD